MLRNQTHYFSKIPSIFIAILLLFFSFHSDKANAQAPGANCGAAVLIGGTGAIPGCTGAATMVDFTSDGLVPSCLNGTYRRDGWYSFINPVLQNVTVTGSSTTASSNLVVQVFGVCGGAELGCANALTVNGAQTEALVLNNLTAGTYYIKITNYSTSTPANMAMSNVCVNVTPPNNDCANATNLTPGAPAAGCTAVAGTTAGASQQATIPAFCTVVNTTNDDVWYTFTTTSTSHVITVVPSASMNAVFEVFSTNPCGGGGTSINCTNVNGAGGIETTTLTGLTIGAVYWVRVYDAATNIPATSAFTICIQTPPVNDNCANAIVLTPSAACVPITGDVNVSSNSGIAVSGTCATSNPDDDVWYTFTATGTSHTITVTGTASFDPGFEVFTGPCGGLTSVFCNAPGGVPGTTLTSVITTSVGVQYWVRVYDYGTGYPATTSFTICILNPPPPNDDCSGAIALTPLTTTCVNNANMLTGDVSGATQTLVGCSGNANDDVWYSFTTTATALQPYLITVTGNGTFDPVFQVFGTSCGGASLACINTTGTGGTESTTLSTGGALTASTTYWVRVYDAGAGYPTNTTFTICITIPPINDDCGGITIPVYGTAAAPAFCGGTTAGTLAGATASGFAATCGGTPNDDVWYNFVATSTSHIITVVPCASSDIVIQGYKNSCGTGISLGCANVNGAGGTETLTVTGLVVGVTYWVRVYDFTGTSACNTFNICVSTPPVNDPCAGAVTLTPNTTCTATAGTIAGATQSNAVNCGGVPNNDVWYTFNAGGVNQTITVTASAGLNVVFELYSTTPCGGAGTSLGCTNSFGVGVTESTTFTTLTSGAQYWVRVYDASGAPTTYTFTICVVTPINTFCSTALNVVCGTTYTGNSGNGVVAGRPTISCTSNAAIGNGLWYVMVGTGNNVQLNMCGSSYDTQIYVFTGTCGALTCLAGNDDSGVCGVQSICTFGTTVGVNYYIYISGYAQTTGAFTMIFNCFTPPVNDQCAGAIALSTGCGAQGSTSANNTAGSTVQGSTNGDLTGCGTASGATAQYPVGLWYTLDGTMFATSNVNIGVCGAGWNTMLGVWSATSCAGPFTCVAGNDDFCGTASQVSITLVTGTMYYIEVFGYYTQFFSGPATGAFTLNVQATGAGCQVLPIELLSFTGENAGKRNLIRWRTATETNNDYFTIEKAIDGASWMTLDRVDGAGTSTTAIDYHLYDNEPYTDVTYYRLKQTDYNGAYTYSTIIAVNNNLNEVSVNNVHPNPTTNDISFDFNSGVKGNLHIQILDYLGQIVSDEIQNVNDGTSVINSKMGSLSKGVYSLKVMFDQGGYVSVTKVVKD